MRVMTQGNTGFLAEWRSRASELRVLYEGDVSQQALAQSLGCSQALLSKLFRELGILGKSKGRKGAAHHGFKDGRETRLYRTLITKTECERCHRTDHLAIHHKNNDHYDNRAENLAVYCQGCHQSEHKKAWWAAKKAGLPLPTTNGPVRWKAKPRKSNRKSPTTGVWAKATPIPGSTKP